MPTQTNNNTVLWIIAIIAVAGLVFLGISLMRQSQTMYEYSVTLATEAKGKTPPVSIQPGYTIIKDGYAQAFSYFMLALGILILLLLLPRLQTLAIGPAGITLALREVQQNIDAVIKQNNAKQAESAGTGGKPTRAASAKASTNRANPDSPDDPQKGKWGEKPVRSFRQLSATVATTDFPGLFRVVLTVKSTNEKSPLKGIVTFHLHNTFRNQNPVIAVQNGQAILELPAVYGAFTVGAETDDGIKLELDLAADERFPKTFREK